MVAAGTLEEGVGWCEAVLGATPGAGGKHVLMSTHNRLLALGGPYAPRAYLEIIAIDTEAGDPGRARWFDMDSADMHRALQEGPRLIHFVASVADLTQAASALAALGIDRGALLDAQRETPGGTLRWKISVRDDGQRLFYGALPTLIEWGETHPSDGMAPSPVRLESLHVTHPRPDALRAAYAAIGLTSVAVDPGLPSLIATLSTPRGRVELASEGV